MIKFEEKNILHFSYFSKDCKCQSRWILFFEYTFYFFLDYLEAKQSIKVVKMIYFYYGKQIKIYLTKF